MGEDGNLDRLLASATLVVAGRAVGSATVLGERVVLGRLLSPEGYGEVSVALAVLSFAGIVSLLGFTQGVPRYVSRFEADRDRRGVWAGSLAVAGGLSLAVAGGLVLAAGPLSRALMDGGSAPGLVAVFAAALPFVAGMRLGVATIRGFENTRYKTLTRDVVYPVTRLVAVLALLWAGWGVLAAGYAYLLAAALSCLLAHALLSRLLSLVGPVRTHVREVLGFSAPLVLAGFLTTLLTWTDTVVIGYFRPSFEVGQYSAAYTLAGALVVTLSAFGFLYLPMASRLDADSRHGEIDRIYATSTKWVYVVTFPAFLVFLAFPGDVLRVFVGGAYAPAAAVLPVLAVGFFSNAVGGRNRETLSALGRSELVVAVNGTAFALNLALNLLLVPRYGYLGAGVASTAAILLQNAVACGFLLRGYGISPFSSASVRTFLALPVVLVPPVYLAAGAVSLSAYTLLPALVGLGLLSLAVVAAVGGVQPEDRVAVEFVEDLVGVRIPLVRRYIPEA